MESKKFAWLPTKVTSGKRIWMSYYILHRNYVDPATGMTPLFKLYFEWTETPQEKTWRLLNGNMIQNRNVWNSPILTKQDKI